MSLIVCQDLGIAYGADVILRSLDLRLDRRDRVAIVGANGAGKTSLLDILAGQKQQSSGTLERARSLRAAYLPQDAPDPTADTVLGEVIASRTDLAALHEEMRHLEEAMSSGPPNIDRILERYGDVQHRYQDGGGYDLEALAREALGGLGLDEDAQRRDPRELSGGQIRRVEMAKLLLQDADLLLVDEPTNHLDLAAIEWLEDFLSNVSAALVVVSHDRRFLDSVCTRILELHNTEADEYAGNYTAYVRQRAERHARRRKEFETQQAHIQHQEDFIRKYKAGQRAKQARGRQTLLDRLDRVPPPVEVKRPRLRFAPAPSSNVLLKAHELVAGRDRPLVTLHKATITPGERIAIVGPNGSGKSTLLHTIAEELPALRGKVTHGARMHRVLYRQDLNRDAQRDAGRTVLDDLLAEHPVGPERGRTLLGALLFSGDDVHKTLDTLSGGERARLELGKVALEETNLLLLDEPTNHLDIPAQEVLEGALQRYAGGVILVTHDRALIDAVATRTWAIEDGAIREVLGGYTDLLREREREAREAAHAEAAAARATAPRKVVRPRDRAGSGVAGARPQGGPGRQHRIEAEIAEAEEQLRVAEAALHDPATFSDPAIGAEAGRAVERLTAAVAELYERWETAAR